MQNNPRIAFCFSWQARTLAQTYKFFQKNLFEAAKKQWFYYDVFCTIEDDEDRDKVNLLNPTMVKRVKSSDVKKIIEGKRWDFINHEYEQKYGYSWKSGAINVLQQFYKICQSIKLKNQYEFEKNFSYDMVFKLRFDAPFARELNFSNILKTIKQKDKIVLCNRNKLMLSAKFIINIEDFYFIMDNQASNIFWEIFEKWDICFKWYELKHKKLNKTFLKIETFLYNNLLFLNKLLPILFSHIYAIFFQFFSAEIYIINYFKNYNCEIKTNEYITIYLIRDDNKYKSFDFRTHTKKHLFKKWAYEL